MKATAMASCLCPPPPFVCILQPTPRMGTRVYLPVSPSLGSFSSVVGAAQVRGLILPEMLMGTVHRLLRVLDEARSKGSERRCGEMDNERAPILGEGGMGSPSRRCDLDVLVSSYSVCNGGEGGRWAGFLSLTLVAIGVKDRSCGSCPAYAIAHFS